MKLGSPAMVEKAKQKLEMTFTCKYEAALMEHVGNKIIVHCHELGLGTIKFTQPELVLKHWEGVHTHGWTCILAASCCRTSTCERRW